MHYFNSCDFIAPIFGKNSVDFIFSGSYDEDIQSVSNRNIFDTDNDL